MNLSPAYFTGTRKLVPGRSGTNKAVSTFNGIGNVRGTVNDKNTIRERGGWCIDRVENVNAACTTGAPRLWRKVSTTAVLVVLLEVRTPINAEKYVNSGDRNRNLNGGKSKRNMVVAMFSNVTDNPFNLSLLYYYFYLTNDPLALHL